jgi:tungstate transport system ATP-binding protein
VSRSFTLPPGRRKHYCSVNPDRPEYNGPSSYRHQARFLAAPLRRPRGLAHYLAFVTDFGLGYTDQLATGHPPWHFPGVESLSRPTPRSERGQHRDESAPGHRWPLRHDRAVAKRTPRISPPPLYPNRHGDRPSDYCRTDCHRADCGSDPAAQSEIAASDHCPRRLPHTVCVAAFTRGAATIAGGGHGGVWRGDLRSRSLYDGRRELAGVHARADNGNRHGNGERELRYRYRAEHDLARPHFRRKCNFDLRPAASAAAVDDDMADVGIKARLFPLTPSSCTDTIPSPFLSIQDLRVEAKGQVLLSVPSLTVARGEVLTLIGPNGAGKSTLLQAVAGLHRPTTGVLSFDGHTIDLKNPPLAFRRRLAVVFQEPLLFDTTVEDNVASGLKLRGVGKHVIRERVALWLERLGIAHLARRQARTLSGGEAQRTSLARAFVLDPDLLLLDEPFSALDPQTCEALTEAFHALQRQTGVTTLFVTHDRLAALRLGDRVAVMHRGEILQVGTPEEVFSQPSSEAVASFVGIETILRGRVSSQNEGFAVVQLHTGPQVAVASTLPLGAKVTLCIRPEEVTLFALPAQTVHDLPFPPSSARNAFSARVSKIVPWGMVFKVHLDCGFPLVAFVTRPSLEVLNLREGNLVGATFKATAVHVIAA